MADIIEVPSDRLEVSVLNALLQEYASRDGTDYGARELSLEAKVASLLSQLQAAKLALLYDADSEQWDLVEREQAVKAGLLSPDKDSVSTL